eukprot:TCONS_00053190-protein
MVIFSDDEIAVISQMVRRGFTHEEVSQYFIRLYPGIRGYSARSIRRACNTHHITRISDIELDDVIRNLIVRYGNMYGRTMMQGSVNAILQVTRGAVSQRRIARSLQRVDPVAYDARRRDVLERTNPIPYYAPYFGYKVHMDQNEKIAQRYGCTHVVLIDGCSRMVCGFASMEVKNPILIYEFVFRPAIQRYGLWDQLRVDHGTEFFLCLFIQDLLKNHRVNQHRVPWRQTTSTENYVVERFWPEVNSRVNYPLKRALNQLAEMHYDLTDPLSKFCISWVTLFVVKDSAQHLVNSWNHHRVPGSLGCVPVENMIETQNTAQLPEIHIPTTAEAVRMYLERGGQLNHNPAFGVDPLLGTDHLYESRNEMFHQLKMFSADQVFSDVLRGDYHSLKSLIDLFVYLTSYLNSLDVQ